MCYSAQASFTLSTILFSTGIYSAITACHSNKNYFYLSLIPVFFGLQQGIEGIIWWRLHSGDPVTVHLCAYVYLFFACFFWPTFVPLSVYCIEKDLRRKKIISGLIIAGLLLGSIIYWPIVLGLVPSVVTIEGLSIHYEVYPWGPLIWTYTGCYIIILTMPFVLSSQPKLHVFGMMLFVSVLVTYWWYLYAFISIWCFFAAILSLYIAYITYRENSAYTTSNPLKPLDSHPEVKRK